MLVQWLVLGISLTILGLSIAFDRYHEHKRTESREEDRLRTQAKVIHDNLASNLAAVSRVLQDLRKEMSRPVADLNLNAHLKTMTEAMPGVRTLMLIDARGTVRASNETELIDTNVSHRAYFQEPRQHPDTDMLYVWRPFQTSLGFFAITVVRMIPGAHGEFSGIVSATLDPEYFRTLLASVIYAPDMWAAIAHEGGLQFMMVPDRSGQIGKNLAQPGSFFSRHRESGKDENVLTGIVQTTGEERMMALRTIHSTQLKMDRGLVVVAGRDLNAVFESWRRDAWVESGLFCLLTLLTSGSLALYQRRQLQFERQTARAEAALQERANFTKTVTDNIPSIVGYYNAELHCGFANSAYFEWLGKTPEQVQGGHIRDVLGEELFHLNETYIHAVFRGERQQFERSMLKADGSIGHTLTTYVPDHDGDLVRGFFVFATDISEQRQREDEFKDLLEFNQEVIAKTESGIMVHRHTGECILANEAAARIMGTTPEQLMRYNFRQDSDTRNAGILQIADRVLRSGVTEPIDALMHTAFGKKIWYVGFLGRLSIKGEGYLLSVFNDISERKKAELAVLKAKEEAEALLDRVQIAERGIVDISEKTQKRIGRELHDDLGQHLTGIAFLSEVLFQKLRMNNQAEQQEAAHITELINAAVAKTRSLAQGLYPVELNEAGLQAMLEQLARNVTSIYKIECEVSFEDNLVIGGLLTSINLYRITQEAINNAIRHGNAKKITIAMYHEADTKVFEISDNGRGISNIEEIMKRGGLGMHTMRYRATLIDATLYIHARHGGGTRVAIHLSAAAEDAIDALH